MKQRILMALLATLAGPGLVLADRGVDETRPLAADGNLTVENLAGLVEIEGWDRPEVRVRGELGDSVEELEISGDDSNLRVRVRNREGRRNIEESTLSLSVPRGASIEARGVSSDLAVAGVENQRLTLETVSGDIRVAAHTERLEAESVSGDVEYSGRSARVIVETVSGDIDLSGVAGEVRVSTVSGDLDLEAGLLAHGRFETVSGDLSARASLADEGRLNAESMSGDVTLVLPPGQQAEFTVQSYSGRIATNFGPEVRHSRGPGASWNHTEGSNGASIRVESFSGDVRIERD